MAKVIEFYAREDWKPNRESVAEGQPAKVIMFPEYEKQKSCLGRGGTFLGIGPVAGSWWAAVGLEQSNEFE
jgi:hypothetical protein